MKIAICDDDLFWQTQLRQLIDEYLQQPQNRDLEVSYFSDAEELFDNINKCSGYDIYLLDILMPDMNGLDLAKELRKSGDNSVIIFLTSSDQYAIDAFDVRAYSYVLKPVKKEKLFPILDEAVSRLTAGQEKNYLLKTRDKYIRLNFDSIMYAELCRRVIVFHLTNGTTLESTSVRTNFEETLQELLEDERFLLCGKGMLANMSHITSVEKDAIVFKETYRQYLPAKACGAVRSAWLNFWFSSEEFR